MIRKRTIGETDSKEEPLEEYPHGYYAFYVPVNGSASYDDEISQFFPYFAQLRDLHLDHEKDLIYTEIGNVLLKV